VTHDEQFLGVIEAIYGAALEPDLWPDALDRVAGCLAADHAHIFIADTSTFVPSFAAVGHGFPTEQLDDYHTYYQALDPRIESGRRLPAGVLYPDHVLSEPAAFERSEFYNDFYRHRGLRWMVGSMLERTAQNTVGFAVVRRLKQAPFDDQDLRRLKRLQPHLTQAARMQRRLARRSGTRALSLETMDRLALGIVILNHRGRTIAVNQAAREIAGSDDGLSLGPDGLQTQNGPSGAALQQAVAAALNCLAGEADTAPVALAIPRRSLKRPYEVLVAPLPAQSTHWGPSEGGVLIAISDPEHVPEPPAAQLARLYGLTPAEARVAAALVAGRTLKAIAEATGTTREGARWHLKQIFQKTGTKRQAELVKLLRAGPLGLMRLDDGQD